MLRSLSYTPMVDDEDNGAADQILQCLDSLKNLDAVGVGDAQLDRTKDPI